MQVTQARGLKIQRDCISFAPTLSKGCPYRVVQVGQARICPSDVELSARTCFHQSQPTFRQEAHRYLRVGVWLAWGNRTTRMGILSKIRKVDRWRCVVVRPTKYACAYVLTHIPVVETCAFNITCTTLPSEWMKEIVYAIKLTLMVLDAAVVEGLVGIKVWLIVFRSAPLRINPYPPF